MHKCVFESIDKIEKKHDIENRLLTIVYFLCVTYRASCFNAQRKIEDDIINRRLMI